MNIVLWIVQVLLALAFFAHGLLFLFPPPEIAAVSPESFVQSPTMPSADSAALEMQIVAATAKATTRSM